MASALTVEEKEDEFVSDNKDIVLHFDAKPRSDDSTAIASYNDTEDSVQVKKEDAVDSEASSISVHNNPVLCCRSPSGEIDVENSTLQSNISQDDRDFEIEWEEVLNDDDGNNSKYGEIQFINTITVSGSTGSDDSNISTEDLKSLIGKDYEGEEKMVRSLSMIRVLSMCLYTFVSHFFVYHEYTYCSSVSSYQITSSARCSCHNQTLRRSKSNDVKKKMS